MTGSLPAWRRSGSTERVGGMYLQSSTARRAPVSGGNPKKKNTDGSRRKKFPEGGFDRCWQYIATDGGMKSCLGGPFGDFGGLVGSSDGTGVRDEGRTRWGEEPGVGGQDIPTSWRVGEVGTGCAVMTSCCCRCFTTIRPARTVHSEA